MSETVNTPPDSPNGDDDLAIADAVIANARNVMRETMAVEDAKAKEFASFTETMDRSRIAKLIVWACMISIGALILFVFVGAVVFQAWSDDADSLWVNAAAQISEVPQDVMLPVVTLVLGFYFGSAGMK